AQNVRPPRYNEDIPVRSNIIPIERGHDRTQKCSNGSLTMEVAMNTAQAVALPPRRAQDRAGRRPASPVATLHLVPSPVAAHPVADHPVAALPVTAPPAAPLPVAT